MDNKKNIRSVVIFFILSALIIFTVLIMNNSAPSKNYNYSEILNKFKMHEVVEYSLNLGSGDTKIKLKNGEEFSYIAPSINLFYADIKDYIIEYNGANPDAPMVYNLVRATDTSWIGNLLSIVVAPIVIIGILSWFFMRRISFLSDSGKQLQLFDKMQTKNTVKDKKKTTFDDVAGAKEEKIELSEVVEFLKSPEKFQKLGARIPKGVLLIGPPGTGKTLLARAVAGEASVPFFAVSGSDFVEMYVGVGASRVRNLFEQAKKNSPCIIFIDEIDAVGRQRGSWASSRHDEEQTLNQLLVEMDGFSKNENVIIIAATNRPDILDLALMRPGRFDRQVVVGYPDIKGREEILHVHAKGKVFSANVKLKTVAQTTSGFTGADLENLLNESALLAARKNLKAITMSEIEESAVKVIMGNEKKSHIITEKEKKITAYHEAGHAVVNYFCPTQDKVHQISIIPRGLAGGYTLMLPEKDKYYISKNEMLEEIAVLLGGRASESLVLNDISTGASSDIKKATNIAVSMVTKYGMSENMGPIAYNNIDDRDIFSREIKNYSEKIAAKIDEEINSIIKKCYKKTEEILKNNLQKLDAISSFLIKNEKMSGIEFENFMKDPLTE